MSSNTGRSSTMRLSRRNILKGGVGAAVLATIGIVPVRAETRPVRYWTWLDPKDKGPRSQVQTSLIEGFEKATGIKVEVELIDWKQIPQQLIRAVAAGEGPDVVRLYSPWIAEQTAAGTLTPLDGLLESWGQDDLDDIGSPPIQVGGETMAVYIENRFYGVLVRTDMLEEAGRSIPHSFQEFGEAAGAIRKGTNGDVTGIIWTANRAHPVLPLNYLPPMVWSLGGEIVDPETKEARFNSEAGIQVFEWIRDLSAKYEAMPKSYINWALNDIQQALNASKLAMFMDGTNRVKHSRSYHEDGSVIQMTHLPSGDGSPPPIAVQGWSLGISRDSTNQENAARFIHHMTSSAAQLENARDAGELPTRKSVLNSPWFQTDEAAEMRGWVQYIADGSRNDPANELRNINDLGDLLNEAAQEIVLNDTPIKSALDRAASRWDSLL